MKEEWLFPNAIVPVDVETTAALVAEIHRLIGVVGGMALAQPEQEPTQGIPRKGCQYLSAADRVCNKCGDIHRADRLIDFLLPQDTPPQRTWVGLTDEERSYCVETPFVSQQWANIEAKLKEKNT